VLALLPMSAPLPLSAMGERRALGIRRSSRPGA
jgi:hypothetical protein